MGTRIYFKSKPLVLNIALEAMLTTDDLPELPTCTEQPIQTCSGSSFGVGGPFKRRKLIHVGWLVCVLILICGALLYPLIFGPVDASQR